MGRCVRACLCVCAHLKKRTPLKPKNTFISGQMTTMKPICRNKSLQTFYLMYFNDWRAKRRGEESVAFVLLFFFSRSLDRPPVLLAVNK